MDAEARFRALFEESYPALRRYAHNRGLAPTDSDDLVAEVYAIAWRRFAEVPVDDPVPWLFGVARNVRRNQHRSAQRRTRLIAKLPRPEPEPGPEPSDASELARIRAAVNALPEADREVLALVAWDGCTPQQAAVALGCSAVAARVRLHRARARLAALLDGAVTETEPTTDLHGVRVHKEVRDVR